MCKIGRPGRISYVQENVGTPLGPRVWGKDVK